MKWEYARDGTHVVIDGDLVPLIMGGEGGNVGQGYDHYGNPTNNPRRTPPTVGPPRPPPPNPLQGFLDQLNQVNPQRFDIGQDLINRGLGGEEDPLIAMRRQQASEQQRGQLARRGIGGSVALNEQNRLNQGFDQASLARQDQLLQGGFGLQQSGLQNLLAEPTLDISRLAAENAGRGGGGGGGGKK